MSIYISMFVEGALSFFSPCIIPVLPVYFGYLASGSKKVDADGNVYYDRLKVFITTCFFVLGISFYSLTPLNKAFYLHCLRNGNTEKLSLSLQSLGNTELV